ncbi:Oidioi.mRNA.OKI2018_I69.PAR.g9662.t2.cds [Oikopleura dioica]|uniref:Oidioi.mRNA.OKI2018_I69.PAR.g9662.t2.cds n=1 Tax=Oikopleura dioica TaxID=34765 RepID=A0ABN7RLK1_OIKDI|nr:Oidioi.mRNA.OKI2018_I69.PAR.g9662.t2.cds [Oikopleura dioica]
MGGISDFFESTAEKIWNLLCDIFHRPGRILNALLENGFFKDAKAKLTNCTATCQRLLSSATNDPIELWRRRAQGSTSRIIDYFYIAACTAPLVYYIYFNFIKPNGNQLKSSAEPKKIENGEQKTAPLVDEPRIEPEETAKVEKKQNVYLHKYFGENSSQNALETSRTVRNRAGGESVLSTFQVDDESGLRKIKSNNEDFMKKFFKSDGSIKAISKPVQESAPKPAPKYGEKEQESEIKEEKKSPLKKDDFLLNFFGSEFDTKRNPNEKVISEEATYSKITVDITVGGERKPSVTNYEPSEGVSLNRVLSSEDFAEKFFKSTSTSPVSEPEEPLPEAMPIMVPIANEIARTTMLDVAFSPSSESSFSTIELELDSGFVQDFSSGNFQNEDEKLIEPELEKLVEVEPKTTIVVDVSPKQEQVSFQPESEVQSEVQLDQKIEPELQLEPEIELEPKIEHELQVEPELLPEPAIHPEPQDEPDFEPELQLEPELVLEPEVEPISEQVNLEATKPQGAPFIIKSQIKISPGKAEIEALQLQNAEVSNLQSLENQVESSSEGLLSELAPVSEAQELPEEAFSPGPVSPTDSKKSYQDKLAKTRSLMRDQEQDFSSEPDNFSTSSGSLYSELQCKPEDEFTKALSNGSLSSSEFEFNRQQELYTETGEDEELNFDPLDEITFNAGFGMKTSLRSVIDAGLITPVEAEELITGQITHAEVERDLYRWLFAGSSAIAGVYNAQDDQVLTISEAVEVGLLLRGTGLELLEAQAATGGIIDPRTSKMYNAIEALDEGLILDYQLDTVRRAERACRGFVTVDVNGNGQRLSLFAAMKRGLVVESRGLRLLEAQIATGGLIDPQAGHRVPISAAYQRGLFDQRMNQILEDPTDDTKGFFDPNTDENLSYLELLGRCIHDPETDLKFLVLLENGAAMRRKRRGTRI